MDTETRSELYFKTVLFGILFSFVMLVLFYLYNSNLAFRGAPIFEPDMLGVMGFALFGLGFLSYAIGRLFGSIVDLIEISRGTASHANRIPISLVMMSAFVMVVILIFVYPDLTKAQEITRQEVAEGLSIQPVFLPLAALGEIVSYFFLGVINDAVRKYRIAEINKRKRL
jgi:hypothetical protein